MSSAARTALIFWSPNTSLASPSTPDSRVALCLWRKYSDSDCNWLKASRPRPRGETGLAAAQQEGMVQRDVKPGNPPLTRDGRLKILDFCLAQSMPQPSDLGRTAV